MLNSLHFWWLWFKDLWGVRHTLTVVSAVRTIVALPLQHLRLEEKIIGVVSLSMLGPFAWTLWQWFPQIAMWTGCVLLAAVGTTGVVSTLGVLKGRLSGETTDELRDDDESES